MKKFILVLFLLPVIGSAQIKNLSRLSSGALEASDIIQDVDHNVKGYVVLFSKGRESKKTYKHEYVILDENLNKVTESEFILGRDYGVFVSAQLYKKKLLLRFFKNDYQILDLNTNTAKTVPSDLLGGITFVDDSYRMMAANKVGFILKKLSDDGNSSSYVKINEETLTKEWEWVYATQKDKKKRSDVDYLTSDENVIVMLNHYKKNEEDHINDYAIVLLAPATGKVIATTPMPDSDKYAYRVVNTHFEGDKIVISGHFSKKTSNGIPDDTNSKGMFRMKFDKATGKFETTDLVLWDELSGKMRVDENGFVATKGYLYIHDMMPLSDGSTIVVTETYKRRPVATNDMYFIHLDNQWKPKTAFEVEKARNSFEGLQLHSYTIKKNGLFDYMDYQTLGTDEFLFLFNDDDKSESKKKKNGRFGAVSFSDGKFDLHLLDLKTESSSRYALNAKRGYVLLFERFDDSKKEPELRLEKINY